MTSPLESTPAKALPPILAADPIQEALEQGLISLGHSLLIDTLCRLSLVEMPSLPRLRQGLMHLAAALHQGGLCIQLEHLPSEFLSDLQQGRYAAITGKPGEYKPLILDQGRLYPQLNFSLESEVASLLAILTTKPTDSPALHAFAADAVESALEKITVTYPLRNTQGNPLRFTGEREDALRNSLSHRIFAITGGPGTGKTSLSANLLRLHRILHGPELRIALAAPTGRAAARLTESLRQSLTSLLLDSAPTESNSPNSEVAGLLNLEATTLHRLLGYEAKGHRFRHHAHLPIEADLILVDEASMIDLGLFRALLQAIPEKACLILLGDADQLPSVEAGSVLADLGPKRDQDATKALLPWVKLAGSHRSEPPLTQAAELFLKGDIRHITMGAFPGAFLDIPQGATLWSHSREKERQTWEGAIIAWLRRHAPNSLALASLRAISLGSVNPKDPEVFAASQQTSLEWTHDDERSQPLREIWSNFKRARLLAMLRQGPEGVSGLNAFATQFWKATWDPQAPRHAAPAEARFFHGAPVMLQRNDFNLGLANGDLGIALRLEGRLWVAFESSTGFMLWPLAVLPEPELAFATTVHKSQGSEYEEILLVLPQSDHPLLSREVVYTALTRAKKAAFMLGDSESLRFAANRTLQRESGLRDRLYHLQKTVPTPIQPHPEKD